MEYSAMAYSNRTRGLVAMAALLAGVVMAGVPAFAQMNAPAAPQGQEGGMMKGMEGGQGGSMPGMMMSPEMMQKMSRMMDNCNRMMETMQKTHGTTGPAAPANKG